MDIVAVVAWPPSNQVLPWLLLYIGPDVFLPLTSALAAVVGVILMFWQRVVGWARSLWRMVSRRKA
jgi:hypothetical protein